MSTQPWMDEPCTCAVKRLYGDHKVGCPRAAAFRKFMDRTPQPSEQPRTAAGRTLLNGFDGYTEVSGTDFPWLRDAILAIEAEAAAPDPVASRLWAERNHYLAGCVCPASPWCAPHGWAGTVEPDDHSICADHPHVDPEGRADIPDALKRLEPAPDPVASPSEAVRLLRAVLDQFDYWSSDPRPAVDGGTVRLHKFGEVQPEMERVLDEARRFLEGAVATPAPLDVAHLFRVPFDRDYALVPDEADGWTEDQFDAFYEGLAAGIQVVKDRFESPELREREARKLAALEGQPVAEEPA